MVKEMNRSQFHHLVSLVASCVFIMVLAGCPDRGGTVATKTPNKSASQPVATKTLKKSASQPVDAAGYQQIKTFKRGNLEITIGQNRPQVRTQMAGGRQKFHKVYAFGKVDEAMFARDVWELSYGPEEGGMGRVDLLRLTFKHGVLVKLEIKSILCP